jgi:acetate---CoA ligase (ADP-forming)
MSARADEARGHVRDVILRDGRTLRLRPPAAPDAGALGAFLGGLSADSIHRRFHGFLLPAEAVADALDPDWDTRGALVAVTAGEDGDRIAGLASYDRLRDPRAAEVAFVVAEDLRAHGVATRMLEQLAEEAGHAGVERFVAEVLPGNRSMLRVFEESGFDVTTVDRPGEVLVEFPILSDERFRAAVDRRHHAGVVESLRPVFDPASVAVVGASAREGSIGGALFRNVVEGGYTGAAYPVNRSGEPVAGRAAYPSVAALPERVELAVVAVPGPAVLAAAAEALAAGVGALCVVSAGFAEVGEEGRRAQEELLALVRGHGARLVGPNCLGVFTAARSLNATFARRGMPAGNIALSSQSGAVGLAVIDEAAARGLGFSAFVSVGNKSDVSSNDLLEYWEDDPRTAAIALYLESFGNPRRFARIAGRVARSTPIVALKSGRTRMGQRAAMSHTAALAGSDTAAEALFRQAGVIRAHSLEEFSDTLQLLSLEPPPRGDRVAIVSNAGGLAILCADACGDARCSLAALAAETRTQLARLAPPEASFENPVDLIASATAETFASAARVLLADDAVDALIAIVAPTALVSSEAAAAAVAGARAEAPGKPVVMVTPGADVVTGAMPSYRYPESAARAVGRAVQRGAWLSRPVGRHVDVDADREAARAVVAAALAGADDAWLEPSAVRALLSAYGVPFVDQRVAADPAAAREAAAALGYPLAVKSAAPGAHKTETGGVVLGIADATALDAAVARVGLPAVLQPMVAGSELFAGAVQDPVFGPVVAFGPGGVSAELIGGTAFATAPLTDVDARELVTTGKAGRLVSGFRGRAAADVPALVDLVLRTAALVTDLPQVAELDLNPVMAVGDACVAVDGRVRVTATPPRDVLKTW